MKRCAVELGFPGVVIASELQDQPLDAEELRPFWKACADLGLYVFIHPLPRVIRWGQMGADDLGRMLGWEFSLMTATVRIINCGLLDDLPALKIQFSHFSGGIGRYLGRIRGFQQRDKWGTAKIGPPRPPAAKAVRLLSRSAPVLRHRRLGRTRSRRRMGRRLGALRHRGTRVLAARVRHRLSAGGARGERGCGLYRGGARARRQWPRARRRRQCRKAHPRSGATCRKRAPSAAKVRA